MPIESKAAIKEAIDYMGKEDIFGATDQANTMDIFSDLSSQTYKGSKAMLRYEGPQQSHHPGEPQAPDSGRNCTSAGWSSGLHEGRCP